MPYDKRDDNSLMDGVPVKISEKYKRRPVIRLPSSCQHCTPGPAFYDKYDFRLENSMLSRMADWKKRKDEQCQVLEERAKNFETLEKPQVVISEEVVEKETISKNEITINGASCVQPNILMPMNATLVNQQISRPRPIHSNFNVSDFETDNSSPFDNMELKTINDMEVLASVLSTSSDNQAAATVKNQISPPPINNNFIPNENGVVWNNWNGHMFSSPQYYEPAAHFSNIYPNTNYNLHSHPSQMMWHGGENTPVQSSTPHIAKANYINYSVNNTENVVCDTGLQPPKNNSKSVPDLVLELENELKEKQLWNEQRRKTQTPPPRPTVTTSLGLEDWKPWPDLESPRHIGPDAVETLDVPLQTLAKSVSEMGFPIERVVRTIRKFQSDDKKVIEFLLQVQRFEEKKFKGHAIEKALHANNYDDDETLKHLEATAVLLDLGFDPEKIKNILLDCKNDRDAALERLIS